MAAVRTTATEADGGAVSASSVTVGVDALHTVPSSGINDEAAYNLITTAQSCVVYPGTTVITTSPTTTYYKLRGYNTGTSQFEVWTSTDPYSSPPSLATLIDVTYLEFNA